MNNVFELQIFHVSSFHSTAFHLHLHTLSQTSANIQTKKLKKTKRAKNLSCLVIHNISSLRIRQCIQKDNILGRYSWAKA